MSNEENLNLPSALGTQMSPCRKIACRKADGRQWLLMAATDTGVSGSFLTASPNITVPIVSSISAVSPSTTTPQCNGSKTCAANGTKVEAFFNSANPPLAAFGFTANVANEKPFSPNGVTVSLNPPEATPSNPTPAFLNTGFQFYNAFTYFYDSVQGYIGIKPIPAQ